MRSGRPIIFALSDPGPRADSPPDPPGLATGVELIGVLPGSGFKDTQYLVKRDGQFVQVTELLFRTLETLDGRRTYEEIAEVLTAASPWAVTPEQIHFLVVEKLGPLGLVRWGSRSAQTDESATGPEAVPQVDRSALMVQAPIKLVGEGPIEAVTAVTRHLFATPAVILLVAAAAIGHVWLFLVHGVENGFLEVLYSPGLLIVVVALIVVAALVHEFGHASGLRHGGRRAKSIGAGLYLVYPAFFTDVSEGYALSKAARLRTDLGGIYFHLLFGLALIGIYQLTGWEFLLFTVLLLDIEAVRQILPFGRLDGYWILADLTGIPDPLSQMAPFLRGVIEKAGVKGSRLPALRPWARRIFIGYIALTLPAIAIFIVLLIARLPVLVGLVWDALRLQGSQLFTAVANASYITATLSAIQIGLITLELVATGFILTKLGKQGLSGLVSLGRRGGVRRLGASAAGVAAIGVLALLWVPHVAGLGGAGVGGVQYFDVASRNHVDTLVGYPQIPPVGGDHSPVWQNCGFYTTAVPNERAVHSMEHGAVWITYQPTISEDDLARLRALAKDRGHVLVSPLPGNPAPIVATAWGRQLQLDRADDPRLEQFITAFRLGSNAPERGGPCEGGEGTPDATGP